ncbi:MAG TPA: amidohydrolase family protein [Roseiflexaceae bacterium]|nr:amidohydrolase family protein [Roseiflexaceae bacterium]
MNEWLTAAPPAGEHQAAVRAIDCDLHPTVPSIEVLTPYLSAYWREQISLSGFKGPVDSAYPASAATSAYLDMPLAHSGSVAEQLSAMRTQVFGLRRVAYGILNCAYAVDSLHNPDAAAALASALNDWLLAEWLTGEPRLRAALVVPSQYPELAAREIERVGSHPGFVQVLLPVRSAMPYGNRCFHPLFAAAARHDLPIGIHFGGAPGNPPAPVGWPSFYLEEYAGMASVFQSQVLSIVSEGLFDQFPALRVVLIESGCTWMPSLMWRFDKEWKGLRREVPWVRRLPSEYIREHVRLTLQPFDAPPSADYLLRLIDRLGSEEMLLFASDYPHWHDDGPEPVLSDTLSVGLAKKILYDNARVLYRL